jgi:hypothetical protein
MMFKIFGAFVDDNEMRLVMFAVGPLYSEGVYDPNKGLEAARKTVYRAETHSTSSSMFWDTTHDLRRALLGEGEVLRL